MSPMRTWELIMGEDGRVAKCEHSKMIGKTIGEVQNHCIRLGWLLKTY